jgi:hypothetical protein
LPPAGLGRQDAESQEKAPDSRVLSGAFFVILPRWQKTFLDPTLDGFKLL